MMKKLVKPFKVAFLVTSILNLSGILFTYFFHGGFEEVQKDLLRTYPISISVFFFPPFFSLYFYQKERKFFFQFLKPAFLSFVTIFLLVFAYFAIVIEHKGYNYFTSIFNGIIAFFLSIFFSVLQFFKNNQKKEIYKQFKNFNYSKKKLLMIPLVATVVYVLIIFFTSASFFQGLSTVISTFLFSGIFVSFATMHFLKIIYPKYQIKKRKLYTVLYYLGIILIFSILGVFRVSFVVFKMPLESILRLLSISLVLSTPFYLFVLSFTHLYFLQLLNRQEKEFIKQESVASQLNYQQLKNQLSPHFLFNNINVLTALIEENPKKAVGFSERLSNTYRYFLEQEKQDVVLLQDEITFAKDYLFLLQSRFENGLSFTFEIEKSSEEKYVVATTLQQVLENVVKHNEVSADKPIHIFVHTKNDYLVVKNNINPKITTSKGMRKGIDNIKKRYAYFSDNNVVIEKTEKDFTIQLPLLIQ